MGVFWEGRKGWGHGGMSMYVMVWWLGGGGGGFVVVVVLLFYVHGKHLRSCRDGQLT